MVIAFILMSVVMQAQKNRGIIPQRDTPGEYAENDDNDQNFD